MNKIEVLLHLGLPKTATSSLQHNVLQKLHEERRINFLGKCLSYDLISKKLNIKNYTGKFIRDGAEGKISIKEVQDKLPSVLDNKRLNVFSDEGLMIAYPGKKNISILDKFKNIVEIFREYDLRVVVTLRDPVDYLYSLYVELYPDYLSKVRYLNSLNKFTNALIKRPNDLLFESFFYDNWLGVLEGHFTIYVLSYEKLANEDEKTVSTWAGLLNISESEFSDYFNKKKINVKKKTGKEVRLIKDFNLVEEKLICVAGKVKPAHSLLRWAYNVSGLKKAINYRYISKVTHKYPSGEHLGQLRTILELSSQRNDSL